MSTSNRAMPAKNKTIPAWVEDALENLPALATKQEVAAAIRVSKSSVHRMVLDGRLPTIRTRETGSARVFVPRRAVAEYLETLVVDR